jgi:hypothetical protein
MSSGGTINTLQNSDRHKISRFRFDQGHKKLCLSQ